MSPAGSPALALENQALSPTDAPHCSTSCSNTADTPAPAPDLAAVLTALAALSPQARHALAALLSVPPSPRPTAPTPPASLGDLLPHERREAKGETG